MYFHGNRVHWTTSLSFGELLADKKKREQSQLENNHMNHLQPLTTHPHIKNKGLGTQVRLSEIPTVR